MSNGLTNIKKCRQMMILGSNNFVSIIIFAHTFFSVSHLLNVGEIKGNVIYKPSTLMIVRARMLQNKGLILKIKIN